MISKHCSMEIRIWNEVRDFFMSILLHTKTSQNKFLILRNKSPNTSWCNKINKSRLKYILKSQSYNGQYLYAYKNTYFTINLKITKLTTSLLWIMQNIFIALNQCLWYLVPGFEILNIITFSGIFKIILNVSFAFVGYGSLVSSF